MCSAEVTKPWTVKPGAHSHGPRPCQSSLLRNQEIPGLAVRQDPDLQVTAPGPRKSGLLGNRIPQHHTLGRSKHAKRNQKHEALEKCRKEKTEQARIMVSGWRPLA